MKKNKALYLIILLVLLAGALLYLSKRKGMDITQPFTDRMSEKEIQPVVSEKVKQKMETINQKEKSASDIYTDIYGLSKEEQAGYEQEMKKIDEKDLTQNQAFTLAESIQWQNDKRYEEALQYYLIAAQGDDLLIKIYTYRSIFDIYRINIKDNKKALEAGMELSQLVDEAEKNENFYKDIQQCREYKYVTLISLGEMYDEQEKYNEAYSLYTRAREYRDSFQNDDKKIFTDKFPQLSLRLVEISEKVSIPEEIITKECEYLKDTPEKPEACR